MEYNYKKLTPFKMQCLTNFPFIDEDFDALSNYGLLCKIVEYMNNLSNNNNLLVDNIDNLNNWFKNLDVTKEINDKLDEMAKDGSLTELIKNYINPIQDDFERTVNANINNQIKIINEMVDSRLTSQDDKISKIESGSPIPVQSVEEMSDTNRIYVNTTDGYWYYYNGSMWVQGNVYQAIQLADGSIDYKMFSENLKDDFNNKINYKDFVYQNGKLILKIEDSDMVQGNIDSSTGIPTESNVDGIYNKELIYLPPNVEIDYESLNDFEVNSFIIYLYDINKNYINYINYKNLKTENPNNKMPIVENAYYMRFRLGHTDISLSDIENVNIIYNLKDNHLVYENGNNLVNIENSVPGFIQSAYGNIISAENYNTTDYIELEKNQSYTILNTCRFILFYDEVKSPIPSTYLSSNVSNYKFTTPENAKYIRYTYAVPAVNIMMHKGENDLPYEPYKLSINKYVGLTDIMKEEVSDIIETEFTGNVLYNKKLVTCGDSFTQWTNRTFDSGIYAGKYKVWPYLIGLRNNMIVNNMAISGSSMAYHSGNGYKFSSDQIYKDIDEDADYIIIKYGINDENNSIPVGTIDDSNNNTFYGAWNQVMPYIIENHPNAKIGIIVTNGLSIQVDQPNNSNYANAIIEIAKKYGIPTLNEWNDKNVPLLIRTGRTDVLESIRNIRRDTFRVSEDNTHENYICQEYESTIIENFIRSL